MINGTPKGLFPAERGLRQGDPPSPFLFLIVGEALSRMINAVVDVGLFAGFSVAKNTPAIGHLQFADDTLIFCGNDEDQIRYVKATLLCFEAVSGLKINFSKSEVIGIRMDKSLLHKFARIMGCKVGELPVMYLGLPLCMKSATKWLWNLVVERVERRLSSCKANYLSFGGRVTVFK